MNKNIGTLIVNKILELIPPHAKPLDYISELLDISRESAYRRLKGKMPFSFEEIAFLSEDLGFSLDELIAQGRNTGKVLIDLKVNKDSEQGFLEKMRRYERDADNRLADKSSSCMLALNYLPAELCVHHENLFRFSYYVWMHFKDRGMPRPRYSEVHISKELENLRKRIDIKTKKVENNTFILEPNVFQSPMKLIHYFKSLELIDNEDIQLLKNDIEDLLASIEKKIRTNGSHLETKDYFYISAFNMEVNTGYYIWNSNASSSFALNFFDRIVITKPEICEAHKEWFLSLKKYSTLITGSNELVQAEYLQKQREYVDLL